jgi:hypothetical protein
MGYAAVPWALPAYGFAWVSDACAIFDSLLSMLALSCQQSLQSFVSQQCMCFIGRAHVRFMPCACYLCTQLVCPQGVW